MSDILNIQREIACAVAGRVLVALTPGDMRQLSRPQPVNPRAYEAFLKGDFYMVRRSREGFQKAFDYFRQAIALDPGFTPAWARLGLCFSLLGFWGHVPPREAGAKALEAVGKALALDESLALAHAVRGWIALYYEWDFRSCVRELDRALQLNPSEWQAHGTLAVL